MHANQGNVTGVNGVVRTFMTSGSYCRSLCVFLRGRQSPTEDTVIKNRWWQSSNAFSESAKFDGVNIHRKWTVLLHSDTFMYVRIFWNVIYVNRRNYVSLPHVHRKVIIILDQTGSTCVEKPCSAFKRRRRALLFWKPRAETAWVVPHGLLAQVQQIRQCFTETPRGHKRDRSRTPDSSHRVLWHLEGRVKRPRVGFFDSSFAVAASGNEPWRPVSCRGDLSELGVLRGQRARSEAAGQRDKHRRFNFSLSLFATVARHWCFIVGVSSQSIDFVIWSCLAACCFKARVAKILMNMLKKKSRDFFCRRVLVSASKIWEITIHHFPLVSELWLCSDILLIVFTYVFFFFFFSVFSIRLSHFR